MRGPDQRKVRIERRLRHQQTDAERKLWFALRDRRLDSFKFVRQEAIAGYVADFVCREEKLSSRPTAVSITRVFEIVGATTR